MRLNLSDIKADDPGGSVKAALDHLKGLEVSRVGVVVGAELNKWAVAYGVRRPVMLASEDLTHPAYELAAAFRFVLENTAEPPDLSDVEVTNLLDGLVTAGLISAGAKEDLLVRATVTTHKYPGIRYGDVEKARAWE